MESSIFQNPSGLCKELVGGATIIFSKALAQRIVGIADAVHEANNANRIPQILKNRPTDDLIGKKNKKREGCIYHCNSARLPVLLSRQLPGI